MALRKELKAIDAACWGNSRVRFRPLETEEDLIYACYTCQLTDEQREQVNPAWFSIGRAYLCPEDNYPCLICSEQGEPVGFINLDTWLGEGDAYSWSYFIDKGQQGKGYGKAAARLAIRLLKAADPEKPIKRRKKIKPLKPFCVFKRYTGRDPKTATRKDCEGSVKHEKTISDPADGAAVGLLPDPLRLRPAKKRSPGRADVRDGDGSEQGGL